MRMHAKQKKSATWSAVRARIATWDRSALVALVKELYELAGVNRDFIHARCEAETGAVLESFQRRVVEQARIHRDYFKVKKVDSSVPWLDERGLVVDFSRHRGRGFIRKKMEDRRMAQIGVE